MSLNYFSLPHLAISSSTPPPPATSPASVKIKSEPISPPRDMLHAGTSGGGSISSGQTTVTTINLASNNNSSMGNNLSTHSHQQQQHLIIGGGRPSSTGHLTPTPGMSKKKVFYLIKLIFQMCVKKKVP